MPEHNDKISRVQSIELGLRPGRYIYKLCAVGCGEGLYMPKRRFTSSRVCRNCLISQTRKSKI